METTDRHIAVWTSCLHTFEQTVQPNEFKTWFTPIKPVQIVKSTLTIEVPSDFFRDYLESKYLDLLKFALKKEIGSDAKLVYLIHPVKDGPSMVTPATEVSVPESNRPSYYRQNPSEPSNPWAVVGTKHPKIDSRLSEVYCFANLVHGECNKMGISAGENISNAPGKTPFNPLFLFGGPGLGKTHLAQAIGLSIHEKFPNLTVLYMTGNEFKTQYMDAVNVRNKLTDFLAFYMRIDVLIVDDIQDLLGQGSQNAFFNIFNNLHQRGKQLVFTSDRAPADLQNFEERLLSRFKWGLAVELTKPDEKTRLDMLKAKRFREGVDVSDEVLLYLASHVHSNFRELEGVFISLIAHATLAHQDCDIELAKNVVSSLIGESDENLTIEKIILTTCEYFNIDADIVKSKSRKREVAQARQMAMYLCRTLLPDASYSVIGREFSGRDHATVLHSCNAVSDLMKVDAAERGYCNDIKKMLDI